MTLCFGKGGGVDTHTHTHTHTHSVWLSVTTTNITEVEICPGSRTDVFISSPAREVPGFSFHTCTHSYLDKHTHTHNTLTIRQSDRHEQHRRDTRLVCSVCLLHPGIPCVLVGRENHLWWLGMKHWDATGNTGTQAHRHTDTQAHRHTDKQTHRHTTTN